MEARQARKDVRAGEWGASIGHSALLERARFSASFVPRPTGRNRFDLPLSRSRVLYLSESPEHAVAEHLQPFRGRSVTDWHLVLGGRPLALARVAPGAPEGSIADLCDPELLAEHGLRPDRAASRRRGITQPMAQLLWDRGYSGLRWWSAFGGDWHTVVLFAARLEGPLDTAEPERLTVETPAVRSAADALGIRIA